MGDELAADFRGTYACVQARCTEAGIGVTLAINEGADVTKERRQVDCSPLAPPRGKGIKTDDAPCQFMCAFAHGDAVPAQCAFGKALAPWPAFFDRARHTESASAAFERLGRFDAQGLE